MEHILKEVLINFSELLGDNVASSVFLVATVTIFTILYYKISTRDLPPGPVGLPLLGYAPFLKEGTAHLKLSKFQQKYGDIFSFKHVGALYINLGSMKALREVLIAKADCFDRMTDYSLLSFLFKDGVGFINGESWKVLKKFTMQQFRELGITAIKDNMSGPVYDCVKETIEYLKDKNGNSVEIVELLTDKCNTILRRTMFGESGITDQDVQELNKAYSSVVQCMTATNLLYTGNISKYFILPFKTGYGEAMKHHEIMKNMLNKIVQDRKSTYNEEHPRDFIDAFFKERNEKRAKGDPAAEYFTDKALVSTLIQFVGDGVLSVAIFVSLFIKRVVEHQEEQEKVYRELVEVVGHGRAPSIEDKSKMPYTNALILEIMRTADFMPMFPTQQCIKETTVRGYRIPVGAIILLNMWECHHDSSIYEEPEKFNPLRFIPKDGKQRPDLPVFFGIGRRACMGEGFTMAQVFLFLTTIIQNFRLTIPENSEARDFDLIVSGKMKVCAQVRNKEQTVI